MQIVLAHVYKKRALNDNVGPYEARVKKVINFIIYIISHYKGSSICDMIGGMEQEIFFLKFLPFCQLNVEYTRVWKFKVMLHFVGTDMCLCFCFHLNFLLLKFIISNSKRWQFQNKFSVHFTSSYITPVTTVF